jgi:hypothetical protein
MWGRNMARIPVQRAAYLTASLGTLIGAIGFLISFLYLFRLLGANITTLKYLTSLPPIIVGGFALPLAGGLLYLAYKPKAWGKLLCLFGFPLIFSSMFAREVAFTYVHPVLFIPAVGGIMLLAAGLALLLHDRGRLFNNRTE